MSATTASPLRVRGATDEPVVLAGPPTRLRGEVHVTNTGSAPVHVRGFGVRGDALPGEAAPGRLTARLQGGEGVATRAALALPATTPPGRYPVRLDVEGHEVEAMLVVAADPSSEVTPGRVLCGPGRTDVELSLTNTGNVALDLAPRTRARLRADPDLGALPLLPRPGESEADDGALAALEVADPAPVGPGERRTVRATVVVPDDVDPERRYLALLPVATTTLRVVVTPAPPPAAAYDPDR